MKQKENKNQIIKRGFTLVELIIVITILAILATIAFLSFQNYTKDGRDASRRVSLSDISKALEVHKTTTGRYPIPDGIIGTGRILGVDLFHVGKVGDAKSSLLKFSNTPLDPLTKTPYAYGLSLDNKYFQVAGTFENINAGTHIVKSTYAATNNKAKVEGNYKGLLKFSTGSNNYIGNVPSLIFSSGGTYDLIAQEPYFVVNNGKNLPYIVSAGDTATNQVKTEVLQSLTGTSSTLTGVSVGNWSTNANGIVAALGYPKDLVGVEVLGTEYYRQLDGSLEFAGITFTQIDAGPYHTCGVTNKGKVMCWGENSNGQLGINSSTGFVIVPTQVIGLDNFGAVQVSAGYYHTCALSNAGKVKCWGYNANGQLGNATFQTSGWPNNISYSAIDVNGLDDVNVKEIALGGYHSCALTTTGKVRCWGTNNDVRLGGWGYDLSTGFNLSGDSSNNFYNFSQNPVNVDTLSGVTVTSISAGEYHTCVITSVGGVKCWGRNDNGGLGYGNTNLPNNTTPAFSLDVKGLTGITMSSVNVGAYYTCGLTSTGGAKCWGRNSYGQLGDNTKTGRTLPVNVLGLTGVTLTSIYTGFDGTSCGIMSTGNVKCWGYNGSNLFGNGGSTDSLIATNALGTGTYQGLAIGNVHACGLTPSGTVKCWGYGSQGKLGNNNTLNSNVPVDAIMP